jgi:hypothetical protein
MSFAAMARKLKRTRPGVGSENLVGGDVLRIERCRKLLQQVIAELVE